MSHERLVPVGLWSLHREGICRRRIYCDCRYVVGLLFRHQLILSRHRRVFVGTFGSSRGGGVTVCDYAEVQELTVKHLSSCLYAGGVGLGLSQEWETLCDAFLASWKTAQQTMMTT
jgi:hypothetical protein